MYESGKTNFGKFFGIYNFIDLNKKLRCLEYFFLLLGLGILQYGVKTSVFYLDFGVF